MYETRSCKQKKKLQINIVNILREIREYVDKITFIRDIVHLELKRIHMKKYKKKKSLGDEKISTKIEIQ